MVSLMIEMFYGLKPVWEKIDLDERINFPYYYPSEAQNLGEERRSLFDVLCEELKKEKLKKSMEILKVILERNLLMSKC